MVEVIQMCYHRRILLETNNKTTLAKSKNIWQLNCTLVNKLYGKEEIKRKKYFLNCMNIETYEIKNWRTQLKKVLMNFIVSNNYKRKQDSSVIYDLTLQVQTKQKL